MATIPQIREAIETRLATLDSLRVVQEFAGPIPVSANASAAVVTYAGATYGVDFDASADLNFGIIVLASKVSDRAGIAKLDALCDPTPRSATALRVPVDGDLGGLVAGITVRTGSEYKEYPIGETEAYLGVEFIAVVQT